MKHISSNKITQQIDSFDGTFIVRW